MAPENDDAVTTTKWRTVNVCACGHLETEHEIRANGTRGKRLGMPVGCPGYILARAEERPPEGELRRRLDAVVELVGAEADEGLASRVAALARGE